MAKTRKVKTRDANTSPKSKLTIPQLRKAFDHMDKVVEGLRKHAHNSFSDAVVKYREEWRKTFKHDLAPADAATYLKFRYGLKSGKTRRAKTRGGGISSLAGAPLDYQTRAGVSGVYGNFPTYQTQGLDRSYMSALTADCGKPNGFPTDGSAASQKGGGMMDGLFRPIAPSIPPSTAYSAMMTDPGKGTTPFTSGDAAGRPNLVSPPMPFIPSGNFPTSLRSISQVSYPIA
jgi:hypothetical protein